MARYLQNNARAAVANSIWGRQVDIAPNAAEGLRRYIEINRRGGVAALELKHARAMDLARGANPGPELAPLRAAALEELRDMRANMMAATTPVAPAYLARINRDIARLAKLVNAGPQKKDVSTARVAAWRGRHVEKSQKFF